MAKTLPAFLKTSLLAVAATITVSQAQAQFRYSFKDTTAAYTALTGATSLNGSTIWDEDVFNAPIPFNWTFDSVNTMTSVPVSFEWPYAGIAQSLTGSAISGMMFGGLADFVDRGAAGTTSLSPISYTVTGTTPNRIFKLECRNVGFYDDPNLNDFVNFQTWIYETSNVIEFHYGSSSVTGASDYFYTGVGPIIGMARDLDFSGGTGNLYFVTGAASARTIDSVDLSGGSSTTPPDPISAWPDSGTVFRFTPRIKACSLPTATFAAAAQGSFDTRFTFTAPVTGLDSLVWDFGDNQRLKITTGFATPVTHTYSTAGRYNASVTAYNACGSKTATSSQVNVSVADIAGLPNVKVYPTIVENMVSVEGLNAGAAIAVYNAAGQQVHHSVAAGGKQAISFANLPAGIYVIRMQDAAGAQGAVHVTRR
jgi:PKD repeat protein